jgi:hypothetical protein
MLGRKDYTQEELDNGRARIEKQLTAYRKLARDIGRSGDEKLAADLEAFEAAFFNNLALTLDRLYVHRLRSVTSKGCTPLNELELIVESLLNNDGVFRGNKVVKYKPSEAVVGLAEGDRIELVAGDFERLSAAVLDDVEARFV